jgi:hypothetical protein
MPNAPAARVCHLTARRMRIRIDDRRRDAIYFKTVATRVAQWENVDRVETNPLTASILVHFSDSQRLLTQAAASNDLFELDFGDLADGPRIPSATAPPGRLVQPTPPCAAGRKGSSTFAACCSSCCF